MPTDDFAKQTERYRQALKTHGTGPAGLRWKDYPTVARRYAELVADLDLSHKTVLDVGCGMGDLLPYLHAKRQPFTYLGVDVIVEYVDIARERYSGHYFKVANPLDQKLPGSFDIVIASGILNGNAPGWLDSRRDAIKKLFSYADEALAFNMAGSLGNSHEGKTIAYADARDILDYCGTLTSDVILRCHYSSKDFTVVMYKPAVEPGKL